MESLKDVRSGPLQRPIAMMKEEDLSITERGMEAHIVVAALVATVTFAALIKNKALQLLLKTRHHAWRLQERPRHCSSY